MALLRNIEIEIGAVVHTRERGSGGGRKNASNFRARLICFSYAARGGGKTPQGFSAMSRNLSIARSESFSNFEHKRNNKRGEKYIVALQNGRAEILCWPMYDQHYCPYNRANGLPSRPKHSRKYEVHQLSKVHNYAQFECNQGADRNKHTNKIMSVSAGKICCTRVRTLLFLCCCYAIAFHKSRTFVTICLQV